MRRTSTRTALVFLAWLLLVVAQSLSHELWRDEVMALSHAKQASSIWGLIRSPPGDGHPLVWYLLLRLAYDVFQVNVVLPVLNFTFAAAAVFLFLYRAPFNGLTSGLFVFAPFALNEYPVISRNYAISMFLMILFTSLYVRERRSPIVLTCVLFILANTNIHSALLSLAFAVLWLSEWFSRPSERTESKAAMLLSGATILLGIVVCFVSIYPPSHDAIRTEKTLLGLLSAIALPGYFFTASFQPVVAAVGYKLAWVAGTALLIALAAGLWQKRILAAIAVGTVWGFSLLFALVHGGSYRHQALLIVFLVCLYWILLAGRRGSSDARLGSAGWGLSLALPALLLIQCISSPAKVVDELALPYSSSKSLANILQTTPGLQNAIVVGAPDNLVEALPYYVSNDLYLTQQKKFGQVVVYSRQFGSQLRLSALLDIARRLRNEHGRPIVMLMKSEIREDAETSGERGVEAFPYTAKEARDFKRATEKIASLRNTIESSEAYDVYVLW